MSLSLAYIEQLLAAASDRPWRAERSSKHGGKIYDAPGRAGTVDQVASVHCGGDCGTGWPNTELIVELVNAAPALLAIAKAAQAWRDKSVHTHDSNCMAGDHDSCTEAAYLDEIRAALSSLPSEPAQ